RLLGSHQSRADAPTGSALARKQHSLLAGRCAADAGQVVEEVGDRGAEAGIEVVQALAHKLEFTEPPDLLLQLCRVGACPEVAPRLGQYVDARRVVSDQLVDSAEATDRFDVVADDALAAREQAEELIEDQN